MATEPGPPDEVAPALLLLLFSFETRSGHPSSSNARTYLACGSLARCEMCQRFLKYAPVLPLALTVVAGCERTTSSPTAPGPSFGESASLTAEPLAVRPEFLPAPVCETRPAFGVRLSISIAGGSGLMIRGFQFVFTDRFGARTFPEALPIPFATAASFPSSSPIPTPGGAALPGTSPVTIPGASPVQNLFVPPRASRVLAFFVRFACDVLPEGTLLVTADADTSGGNLRASEMRIRIGN